MSIQLCSPIVLTNEQLVTLLGDQNEVTQFDETTNMTTVTKRLDNGYQQIFTMVNGPKTTTLARMYYDIEDDQEEVEEFSEEEEITEEQYLQMTQNSGVVDKKKKGGKKSGETQISTEEFEKGTKEITSTKFADGTYKNITRISYNESTFSSSSTETTTKKGKKAKKSAPEIIDQRQDDRGNNIVVTREKIENGHKDTTTTTYSDNTYKSSTKIVYYPVEKEIIETTEIIEKEPTSIKMVQKTHTTNQNSMHQEVNEESEQKVKKSKKKTTENQSEVVEETSSTKKVKKISKDQKAEIMARDANEGVTTMVTEQMEGGYREITTTVFPDGSSRTAMKEYFDPVEEQVTVEKKTKKTTKGSKSLVPAGEGTSTTVIENIPGGYKEITTTVYEDGSTRTAVKEVYEPTEEEYTTTQKQTHSKTVKQEQKFQMNSQFQVKSN